jgi:serine/threonine protein phosphatase 1
MGSSSKEFRRAAGPRLLAIGDIHGCLDQLQGLLDRVTPTPADRLVFLGDYVDRGQDSPGVIDFLLTLQHEYPRSVFLLGNHEQMLLNYLSGDLDIGYLLNGGDATLQQYAQRGTPQPPDRHLDFLHNLQLSYQQQDFLFVHAGLKPGRPLERQTVDDLLWIRNEFLIHPDPCEWGKIIVHGHTPQEAISFTPCRIGLDTGAVYGRRLSCCDVLTRQTWQFP